MFLYLDNAATTPLDASVREAMRPWMEGDFGNPSSSHPLGVLAAEAIDAARRKVARAIGVHAPQVTFTSGGTEANNLAVFGIARACLRDRKKAGRHVLVGPTEHPSVSAACEALRAEGFELERGRLTPAGALDLDDMLSRLRPETVLVAQMLANNELGTIYPVRALARGVKSRAPQAAVHVDAVQAFGKIPFTLHELGAHSLALSGHKIHGPKGTGALVTAEGLELEPLFRGGGQESGLRSGTENVTGIVGLGEAVRLADELGEETRRSLEEVRETLRAELGALPALGGVKLLEPGARDQGMLGSVAALLVPGPPAEVWMHHLETHGVMVSAGSACKAKKNEINPVLAAIGMNAEEARQVLRFSFSRHTTTDEVRRAAHALEAVCSELQVTRG